MAKGMGVYAVDSELKQFQLLTASIELAGNIAGVLKSPHCQIPPGNRELLIESHNTLLMAVNEISPIDPQEFDSLIIQTPREQVN